MMVLIQDACSIPSSAIPVYPNTDVSYVGIGTPFKATSWRGRSAEYRRVKARCKATKPHVILAAELVSSSL